MKWLGKFLAVRCLSFCKTEWLDLFLSSVFTENTLETVDKHYESIEERHTETMKNVEKIEKAVNFMTKVNSFLWSTYSCPSKSSRLSLGSILWVWEE